MVECQIIAIDMRGHGDSKTEDDDDLSASTLALYEIILSTRRRT